MKKIHFFVGAAVLATALISCNDQEYDIYLGSEREIAPVTVHAVQYDLHQGVDSTLVEIVGHGLAAMTDATGCATFKLTPGKYELKMSRRGYLTVIKPFSVTIANEQSDLPITETDLTDIEMYPLTATIKGRVTTILNNSEREYQNGAKVRVQFNDFETDMVYTAETDSEGGYEIDSLPEGLPFTCKANYYENNSAYEGSISVQALRPGITNNVTTIAMSRTENSYSYDIITQPATASHPLTLSFPIAANVNEIRIDDIRVTNTATNNRVGITTSWTNGNRTLIILSADSDGWRKGTEKDYTLSVDIPNVEGGRLTADVQFGIPLYTGPLAPVMSEYDPSTYMISWPLLSNASSYNIYITDTENNDYILRHSFTQTGTGRAEISIYDIINQHDLKVYLVKIVGVNSQYEGNLAEAKVITIANINPNSVFYETATNLLHWNKVKCATSYRIYMKMPDGSYSLKYTVPAVYDSSSEVTLSIYSFINREEHGTFQIKVIGESNGVVGNIGSASEVTIYN